ncbi:hypothetical protein C8J57DRAFT_1393486 [Mycena rebaudengoi]|nr:hypothetical protein C8J57DRAFT_1393486 [Mycena rebaudengoi]
MGVLQLEDLNDDVLQVILLFSDIYTVLCVSRLSKRFRFVMESKHLWILLLTELHARNLIDLSHNRLLHDLSCTELVEEVKRFVVGPKSWSGPSEQPPVILQQTRIPHSNSQDSTDFELLPGGRYLVVRWHPNRIELWDVTTRKLIWSHQPIESLTFFRAIVLPDQNSIVIALLLAGLITVIARVITIDLATGSSPDMFSVPVPSRRTRLFRPSFALCDDIIAWSIYYGGRASSVLLVDYRTHKYLLLHVFPTGIVPLPAQQFSMTLIPGHIVFAMCNLIPPCEQHIRVYSLAVLTDWRSTLSLDRVDGMYIQDLNATVVEDLTSGPHSVSHPAETTIVLHRSPLRRDAYKLMVSIVGNSIPLASSAQPADDLDSLAAALNSIGAPLNSLARLTQLFDSGGDLQPFSRPPASFSTLRTYRFTVSSHAILGGWTQTSTTPVYLNLDLRQLSYSGYVLIGRRPIHVAFRQDRGELKDVLDPGGQLLWGSAVLTPAYGNSDILITHYV